jgi:hypothetical protein
MRTLNDYFITAHMHDISTAGSIYVPVPDKGRIIKIISVIDGTIATANAAITVRTSESGSTNVTGAGITIAHSGSAAGDIDSSEPTALNAVNEGDFIRIITSGASSNTVAAQFTVIIRR